MGKTKIVVSKGTGGSDSIKKPLWITEGLLDEDGYLSEDWVEEFARKKFGNVKELHVTVTGLLGEEEGDVWFWGQREEDEPTWQYYHFDKVEEIAL